MNPLAIDEDGVSEDVKQKEIEVAIEKTKAEQVQKAVEAALKLSLIHISYAYHYGFRLRRSRTDVSGYYDEPL